MTDDNNSSAVIGINFGEKYCRAAVAYEGKIIQIKNEFGKTSTPSTVAFSPTRIMIGEEAEEYRNIDPENTVYDLNRLLGQTFNNKFVKANRKVWPFTVVADNKNKALIEVDYMEKTVQYSPEEITAILIMKTKESAEAQLGVHIRNAVLTVPPSFTQTQRVSMRTSAVLAGLNVLHLINESTAAITACIPEYIQNCKWENVERNIIFGFGGGSLNISYVETNHSHVFTTTVHAVTGDIQLGGEDFDNKLTDFFSSEFKRTTGHGMAGDARAMNRLREACERVKCNLSHSTSATLNIYSLYNGIDFTQMITRGRFEDLCSDLFTSSINLLQSLLVSCNKKKEDITRLILVGGAMQMKKIQTMLFEYFDSKVEIIWGKDYYPAFGAAMHAAKLYDLDIECNGRKVKSLETFDISTQSIGYGSPSAIFTLIPRYTRLPHSVVYEVSLENNNRELSFTMYEEKNLMYSNPLSFVMVNNDPSLNGNGKDVMSLGEFAKGVKQYMLTFSVDASGIMGVSAALIPDQPIPDNIIIMSSEKQLAEQDMRHMKIRLSGIKSSDDEHKKRIELETAVFDTKLKLNEAKNQPNIPENVDELEVKCGEIINWLDEHCTASMEDLLCKEKELNTVKEYILHPSTD